MKKLILILCCCGICSVLWGQDTIVTVEGKKIPVKFFEIQKNVVQFQNLQENTDSIEKWQVMSINRENGEITLLDSLAITWRKFMEINCPAAYPDLKASRKQYNISYVLFGVGGVCVAATIPIYIAVNGDVRHKLLPTCIVGGVGVATVLAGIPFFLKGNKLFDKSMLIYNNECKQRVNLSLNMDLNAMGLTLKF